MAAYARWPYQQAAGAAASMGGATGGARKWAAAQWHSKHPPPPVHIYMYVPQLADSTAAVNSTCPDPTPSAPPRPCCPLPPQVATLRSAVKLEQEQQFLIAKKLQELTNSKNIKLKPVIDQSLIAGFVVEYGSSQIDLSIRGQIEKVAEELTKQMATATA